MREMWLVIAVVGGVALIVANAVLFQFISLWIQAQFSGAQMSLASLIGMRLRKVDTRVIVFSRIRAVKSGLAITPDMLETHYLSGGRVQNVMTAMISAKKAAIPLSWDTATAIDFAGLDVVNAVRTAVHPQTVKCGTGDPPAIEVQTTDGTVLRISVEADCQTNINRLVGGATLETLQQRICDAVGDFVTASADADRLVSNPSIIERHLSLAGLDDGTAWTVSRFRAKARRVAQ